MPHQNTVDKLWGEFIDKYKKEIGLFLLASILIGGLSIAYLSSQKSKKSGIEITDESEVTVVSDRDAIISPTPMPNIIVDVSGAVNSPAVYELEEGSRMQDAVNTAGGFAETADQDYISKSINLAKKLVDGEKIYIPTKQEVASSTSDNTQAQAPATGQIMGTESGSTESPPKIAGKININTASQSGLESLSGIGPVYAQRIIEGRPYNTIQDIIRVKGIGTKTFEKIKDRITVQ